MKKLSSSLGTLLMLAFSFATLAQTATTHGMSEFVLQFDADYGSLSRMYTIHESDEYYSRYDQFYSDWLNKLTSLPFASFSQQDKVDYILLRNTIERRAYALQQGKTEFELFRPALKFASKITSVVQQRRRGVSPDARRTADLFNELKKDIQSNQSDIEKMTRFTDRISDRAANAVQNYRKAIDETFAFYDGYDPQFSWWVSAPHTELDSALVRYSKFLRTWKISEPGRDDGSGIVGTPVGRDEIVRTLGFEFISYTPEELVDIGNKEFAWCEQEMLKASQEMGFGKNWKEALEKVKNDYVDPGKQPALITSLAEEAIEYVRKNDLVTVPALAGETWRMTMMSPAAQRFNPFFLGGEVIQIAFPTNTMAFDDKMMSLRGNNKHFSRATVFHELIPGHHLQGFMNDRYNTHRQLFYTPFWMEGWALYWEMILWDKNFQRSPEDRVGMLFWRMHRCARIIFSLNYHLGKWSPQQCIDFLVDKVGHERANATAEVRRSFTGGYGPLYQLAYMVGAKQFYALRTEWVNSGKMKEKDFHDLILLNGPIPVELIRAGQNSQSLSRDFKTSWRFTY